jgi:gliding motility-associated-like protein
MKNICLIFALSAFCFLNAQDVNAQSVAYKIPATFSPNADGDNDGFKATFESAAPASYALAVFDASGMVVFRTKDATYEWTGMNLKSDVGAAAGVYTWRMTYTENNISVRKDGQVTLTR